MGGQAENRVPDTNGVGGRGGGHKTYGVGGNSWEAKYSGVAGGVGSTGGTKTPVVERAPWGDKPWGVEAKGNIVISEDGPGRGGDENTPAT